jgi:hypothetical protein
MRFFGRHVRVGAEEIARALDALLAMRGGREREKWDRGKGIVRERRIHSVTRTREKTAANRDAKRKFDYHFVFESFCKGPMDVLL